MKKLRDEQKGLIFILIIVLITAIVTLFFAFSLKTNLVQDEIKKNPMVRTLFVVQDDEDKALFTNLFMFNSESGKGALINIPGYTGRIFNSLGRTDRIDEVYNQLGIEAYTSEIEKLLGINSKYDDDKTYNVQYCIEIKIENFVKLCDMLGGMRVFIPSPVDCYSEDGERWLLPSGAVNLDGDKVAVYLQYRLPDESEEEVQNRNLDIMTAFLSALHDNGSRVNQNFKNFASCFNTTLSMKDVKNLLAVLSQIDTESLMMQTVTGSERHVDNQILLIPSNNGDFVKDSIKNTVASLTSNDVTFAGKILRLEIRNGTSRERLAARTMEKYQHASYNVQLIGNAVRRDYDRTVIVDHFGNSGAAKIVGDLIHCSNIKRPEEMGEEEAFTDETVDFTIILGRDFDNVNLIVR